jgi:hypothetical protein
MFFEKIPTATVKMLPKKYPHSNCENAFQKISTYENASQKISP